MRPLLPAAALACALLLTGCGAGLTRSMWEADNPRRQPAKALVVTCKVVATPVTVVVDGATAVACEPEFWELTADVIVGVSEGCARVACR